MNKTLYLKLNQISEIHEKRVYLKDIAEIYSDDPALMAKCRALKIRTVPDDHNGRYVDSVITVLEKIYELDPQIQVNNLGVDICFGGIGINGHVAFNEASDEMTPDEFLAQHTRVLEISRETRVANSIGDLNGALDDMPHYCVTIGINEIYHARKIRLGCFRDWHRSVVRHAAYGERSAHFPVTLLQGHPDINLKFTEFVANLPA